MRETDQLAMSGLILWGIFLDFFPTGQDPALRRLQSLQSVTTDKIRDDNKALLIKSLEICIRQFAHHSLRLKLYCFPEKILFGPKKYCDPHRVKLCTIFDRSNRI